MNTIYPWKVKEGAYNYMCNILNSPETVDYRMDNQICRITEIGYSIQEMIKATYRKQLANEQIYQIKILGIEDREFIISSNQLIHLSDTDMIVIDNNGNRLF